MKNYNKPVVEINSFDVEDIITVSAGFTGLEDQDELQAVYMDFTGDSSGSGSAIVIDTDSFEW